MRIVALALVAVGCAEIAGSDGLTAMAAVAQCESVADASTEGVGCPGGQCFCCAASEECRSRLQLTLPLVSTLGGGVLQPGLAAGVCPAPYHPPR